MISSVRIGYDVGLRKRVVATYTKKTTVPQRLIRIFEIFALTFETPSYATAVSVFYCNGGTRRQATETNM